MNKQFLILLTNGPVVLVETKRAQAGKLFLSYSGAISTEEATNPPGKFFPFCRLDHLPGEIPAISPPFGSYENQGRI
ncbi:MAG: hypothetical protein JW801_18120 [Bacteroidales bacterium]|nr:hypothetical protein [Bacteroidales bacterium]